MQSSAARALVAIVAVAIVVVGFVVLRGGESGGSSVSRTTTTEPDKRPASGGGEPDEEQPAGDAAVPTVLVEDGQPAGGVAELVFEKGSTIAFVVESDVAEEIHIHGYDIEREVEAGGRTELEFPAEFDGVFEVELHGTATQIAELTVTP